jgi:hypothetical protein
MWIRTMTQQFHCLSPPLCHGEWGFLSLISGRLSTDDDFIVGGDLASLIGDQGATCGLLYGVYYKDKFIMRVNKVQIADNSVNRSRGTKSRWK